LKWPSVEHRVQNRVRLIAWPASPRHYGESGYSSLPTG
jgi:hypothetical protein